MGAALANNVWTAAPTAQVSWACPAGVAGSCVRVDVYRNGEFGSTPLPTIFGKLLNISSQGVRATATARVASGNSTNCMRPFAVTDRWVDNHDPTPVTTDFPTTACPEQLDGRRMTPISPQRRLLMSTFRPTTATRATRDGR